jgi:activating signal cointegrator 1
MLQETETLLPEIRLISLWQPWASLAATNLKEVETRHWETNYRGWVAIHATKRPVRGLEVGQIYHQCRSRGGGVEEIAALDQVLAKSKELPLGAILALVRVTDCAVMEQDKGAIYCRWQDGTRYVPSPLEQAVGYWQPRRFGWRMEDKRPLIVPVEIPFGARSIKVVRDLSLLNLLRAQLK